MSLKKMAIAVSALLIPISVTLADDQETQQLHANTYQQHATTSCTQYGNCQLILPATVHIMTAVTNVSCLYVVPPGTVIGYVQVSDDQNSALYYVPTFAYGNTLGTITYGVNAQINLFLDRGQKPIVTVYSNNGLISALNCTISGYHS